MAGSFTEEGMYSRAEVVRSLKSCGFDGKRTIEQFSSADIEVIYGSRTSYIRWITTREIITPAVDNYLFNNKTGFCTYS